MTDKTTNRDHVETLIKRAAEATTAGEAQAFAQGACNAANAMCALKHFEAPTDKP